MSFLALIGRNLIRQRTRTVLTVIGIGIGIMTVVALGAITSGMKTSSVALAHTGGSDFMVAQKGAADVTFSTLAESDVGRVSGVTGVDGAVGALLLVSRVGSNPFFFTYGVALDEIAQVAPAPSSGRLPTADDEIVIGTKAASNLSADIGSAVTIEGRSFRVVGVFESSSVFEAGGGFASLERVQEIARKPDVLTAIYVTVTPGAEKSAVIAGVEQASDTFAAIDTAEDYAEVDQGLKLLDAANLAISLLAVLIGAIGVMNTMIMSVFERTREIGILRAVGWKGSRIIRMIVEESLLLCLVATVFGVAAGIALTRAVLLLPAIGQFLEPAYTADIFVRALVIAVGVALVGALYPAVRAVKLSPMEALRHE